MKDNNRLLLIADGEALIFGIKAITQSSGFKSDLAKTINEGSALVKTKEYKAVLIYLNTGESIIENLELIKAIKENKPQCKVIIFAPSFEKEDFKAQTLKLGVDLYFEEPGAVGKTKQILHSIGLL